MRISLKAKGLNKKFVININSDLLSFSNTK